MISKLSVASEQRESFRIFYAAANKHLLRNKKIYQADFRKFTTKIEQPLLQLAADKLTSLFGDEFMNQVMIDFEFFIYSSTGNSGGTDFVFDDNPEISFFINLNKDLRALYKTDLRLFCLALSDVYTHELIHDIQYMKQYQSVGIKEELLKENIFKNKEYLFKKDARYITSGQYYEDLPYFSNHEEIVCYAKDTARQLLTEFKDKKIILSKLSNTSELKSLAEASNCFFYYYDCFYNKVPGLIQYELLWQRFIRHLCHNLNEDFTI